MSSYYSYTFPALRGTQAGREYYVAMCPLKLLPRIFLFDEASLPPELRAQRVLNTVRIPDIARYITENREDYAFSAITASIDGEVRFDAVGTRDQNLDLGLLVVPMSARFIINDGQHRRAAIERALEEVPELGDETIAVVFFVDAGLERSQQLFADLNKHAVRPTKSIGVLYDYRDPLAGLSRKLAETVPCFKGLTEKEKTSISNRSIKLFTLSGIYQATSALLGKTKNQAISSEEEAQAVQFWMVLCSLIPEWRLAMNRDVSSAELRRDFVHSHNVGLIAIGQAGHTLIQQYPDDWHKRLERVKEIDWSRSNAQLWEGRAMVGGQMSRARQNVQLTAILLKRLLGLSPDEEDERMEGRFVAGQHRGGKKPKKQRRVVADVKPEGA
jgi:DNA sulfur modification protein DndB